MAICLVGLLTATYYLLRHIIASSPPHWAIRDFRTMGRGVSRNSRWASCAGLLRRVLATTRDSSPRYPGEPFALPHARLSKRIDRNATHSGGVYIAQISAEAN